MDRSPSESVSGASSALRFGAADADRFSQYWKVRAAAKRPELFVSGSRTGSFFHLTMHEDDAFWHIKLTLPDGSITRPWEPPGEVLVGVRRLVRLLLPIQSIRYSRPPRAERVIWSPAPPDEETWVEFTVLHCRQGRPVVKNADLLGAVRLADGSEALVIGRQSPAQPGSVTFPVPDREEALRQVQGKDTGALLHGADADGCLWFLNLFLRPRDSVPG